MSCLSQSGQLETHIYSVGYLWNPLDKPVLMAVPKPLLIEIGIHRTIANAALGLTPQRFYPIMRCVFVDILQVRSAMMKLRGE